MVTGKIFIMGNDPIWSIADTLAMGSYGEKVSAFGDNNDINGYINIKLTTIDC